VSQSKLTCGIYRRCHGAHNPIGYEYDLQSLAITFVIQPT